MNEMKGLTAINRVLNKDMNQVYQKGLTDLEPIVKKNTSGLGEFSTVPRTYAEVCLRRGQPKRTQHLWSLLQWCNMWTLVDHG